MWLSRFPTWLGVTLFICSLGAQCQSYVILCSTCFLLPIIPLQATLARQMIRPCFNMNVYEPCAMQLSKPGRYKVSTNFTCLQATLKSGVSLLRLSNDRQASEALYCSLIIVSVP